MAGSKAASHTSPHLTIQSGTFKNKSMIDLNMVKPDRTSGNCHSICWWMNSINCHNICWWMNAMNARSKVHLTTCLFFSYGHGASTIRLRKAVSLTLALDIDGGYQGGGGRYVYHMSTQSYYRLCAGHGRCVPSATQVQRPHPWPRHPLRGNQHKKALAWEKK